MTTIVNSLTFPSLPLFKFLLWSDLIIFLSKQFVKKHDELECAQKGDVAPVIIHSTY